MRGIIYWNDMLYRSAIRLIYGTDFRRRYELVAANIKKGWTVLDLCCGDCHIAKFLDASVKYEGADFNGTFVAGAGKRGIKASLCDLRKGLDTARKFDCVMMMGSLHQFSPREDTMLSSMKKAATGRVIVSEPCKNIVSSGNALISLAAKVISNPGGSISRIRRFTRDEILDIFKRHGATRVLDAGKDLIGIFDL
jgi:hypothetical protein